MKRVLGALAFLFSLLLASPAGAFHGSGGVTGLTANDCTTVNAVVKMHASTANTADCSSITDDGTDATAGRDLIVTRNLLLPATGGVINFDDSDVLITHSANLLTVSGGDLTLSDTAADINFGTGSAKIGLTSTNFQFVTGAGAQDGALVQSSGWHTRSDRQYGWAASSTSTAALDTGWKRLQAAVAVSTNGSTGSGRYGAVVQAETCTDTGGAGLQALTITPASNVITITNSDADGCDITVSETNAAVGTLVTFVVISNAGGTVNFADTAGVTEIAGAFAAAVEDAITLVYAGTAYREVARSNN